MSSTRRQFLSTAAAFGLTMPFMGRARAAGALKIGLLLPASGTFAPLGEAGINVDMVSTSEVRLNVIVAAEEGKKSLAILKKAFGV